MIELRHRWRPAGMDSRTHSARSRLLPSVDRRTACVRVACAALLMLAACGESTHNVGHLKAASSVAPGAGLGMPGGDDDDSSSVAQMSGSGSHPSSSGNPDQGSSGDQSQGGTQAPLFDGGSTTTIPEFDAGHIEPVVPPVCSGAITDAARRELDLYLMVDTNITIPTSGWMNLIRGLKRYVADPHVNGTGVGIGFLGFPCVKDSYKTPTVGVGLLPGNRTQIETAIDRAPAFNLSPLLAAIQGSLEYARSNSQAFPQRKVALVLVTDSITDSAGCGDVTSLSNAVMSGLTGDPAIETYVLAVLDNGTFQLTIQTNPMLAGSAIGPLNTIAVAGGTKQAYAYNGASEDDPAKPSPFTDAMLKLQQSAVPCDYEVPAGVPDDMTGTWLLVNGSVDPLEHLASGADCGDGYSLLKVGDGTRFAHLCTNTCSDIKTAHADLSWVSGCPAAP
jgi:hypothetical protein